MRRSKFILPLTFSLLFAACSATEPVATTMATPQLVPLNLATCQSLMKDDDSFESLQQAAARSAAYFSELGDGTVPAFDKQVSRAGLATIATTVGSALTKEDVAALICDRFRVYRVDTSTPLGVATYTELEVRASRHRDSYYRFPIYEPPTDMVEIDLSQFCPTCERRMLQGRVVGNRVVPFMTRAEIEAGALEGQDYEIGYVADPIDAFSLRLRGTGTLVMEDGTRIYLAYASGNGQPRTDVGDMLIKQGKLTRDQATLQGIRTHLQSQPADAAAVLAADDSYNFYGLVPVGPSGSLGVPITPDRTIAADSRYFPRGAMGFLRVPGHTSRFVFVQDSEVGISGPDRLSLFVGAEGTAEPAKPGELYLVLPQ